MSKSKPFDKLRFIRGFTRRNQWTNGDNKMLNQAIIRQAEDCSAFSSDKIVIGAGLYGLYAALYCGKRNENVLVLECENAPFERATYANQARVHMGYHYPRSFSTAI